MLNPAIVCPLDDIIPILIKVPHVEMGMRVY